MAYSRLLALIWITKIITGKITALRWYVQRLRLSNSAFLDINLKEISFLALSVSCRIWTWAQTYLSLGWMRLPRLPLTGSRWQENARPEHLLTSFDTCKLLWQSSCWCLGFWLFAHGSFPTSAVGLLFGIVFDINKAGGQAVFWYGQLFRQRFELVATASAMNPLSLRNRRIATTQIRSG